MCYTSILKGCTFAAFKNTKHKYIQPDKSAHILFCSVFSLLFFSFLFHVMKCFISNKNWKYFVISAKRFNIITERAFSLFPFYAFLSNSLVDFTSSWYLVIYLCPCLIQHIELLNIFFDERNGGKQYKNMVWKNTKELTNICS